MIAVFAAIILKERIKLGQGRGILTGFIGVLIIISPRDN